MLCRPKKDKNKMKKLESKFNSKYRAPPLLLPAYIYKNPNLYLNSSI